MVLKRWPAIVVGFILVIPAVIVLRTGSSWPRAFEAGAWVVGATGVAFILAGLSGRRGDWVE